MKTTCHAALLAIVAVNLALSCADAAPQYAIRDLGTLGGLSSFATAINARGDVVGQAQLADGTYQAFLWTLKDGIRGLGPLLSASSVNADGHIIGQIQGTDGASHTYLWRDLNGNHMVEIGELAEVGSVSDTTTSGSRINAADQVSGTMRLGTDPNASPLQPFFWQSSVLTPISNSDSFLLNGNGNDLSDSGHVVGWLYRRAQGSFTGQGFLWTGGDPNTVQFLGSLSDFTDADGRLFPGRSEALGVNDFDQVVGWSLVRVQVGAFPSHAFLWQNGSMIDLGTLGGSNSSATRINNQGDIIGSSDDSGGHSRPFIIRGQSKMVDLGSLIPTDSGWTLTAATGINDAGQIVGYGMHNGSTHAFLLTPAILGVDVSSGAPYGYANYLNLRVNDGKQFVIADAWGGHGNFDAFSNLYPATTTGISKLGAYCLLNFDNGSKKLPTAPFGTDQRGELQVAAAFANVGPLPIAFMAIDIETVWSGSMSRDDRVARIADAVQEVRRRGVPAIIYTSRQNWSALTGGSREITGVPLWDLSWNDKGDNTPPDIDAFVGYGPWTTEIGRVGVQYYPSDYHDSFSLLSGITVDLDVCRLEAFALPVPSGAPQVRVTLSTLPHRTGNTVTVSIVVTNTGTADALACRISKVTLSGGATLSTTLPQKFNTLSAGTFAKSTIGFTNVTAGRHDLFIKGTFGGGKFSGTFTINL